VTARELRGTVLAGAAAATLLVLAGCAGVPESSAPRIVEAIPRTGTSEDPDVRVQPRLPQPGQSPKEVVEAFLDSAGSFEHQHRAARQFLTGAAAARWRDDAGAVVLSRPPYLNGDRSGATVAIRADQVGMVDPTGAYTSYPSGELTYSHRLQLIQVDGQWRITNPPPGVIMTASTFNQAYRRLNVYFLNRDESRVVPDPRWFLASPDALPNLLLKALLDGPSTSLADAVKTELGNGVSLASNVVPETDLVRVFLTGLANHNARAQASAMAQIVWTLNQLHGTAVEIYDDGQLFAPRGVGGVQRINDWRSYDPDNLPLSTPCYFVRRGAIWTTDGKATPGPAGQGEYEALSVGVSPAHNRLAVVGRVPHGVVLYVGPARGRLNRRLTASSLTEPTWDAATGGTWTVRNGAEITYVPASGPPVQVDAPDLDRTQRIWKLRLSRDGSRVALLAGSAGARTLYVGAVSSSGSSVTGLRSIVPGLTNVVDATWASADSLVVLTTNGAGDATMYTTGVDGSWSEAITTAGLPGPPTEVAAAPGQATLAVAEGGVWRLRDPHEGWTGVFLRGTGPPDAAPAYPG
jgi:hypothetical protein